MLFEQIVSCQGMVSFIWEIYGSIQNIPWQNDEYFKEQTILSTWNEVIDDINKKLLQMFLGGHKHSWV